MQQLDVHLIVCLIMTLFFQRVVNEKLIYNTNRFVLQELRKASGAGFLIIINYIYNQLYNLQGWFVIVSDCEELVGR